MVSNKRILTIGDTCIDHYTELGKRFPGGNALNVAVYASRIPGIKASYMGVVGTDENGDFILDQVRRQGLTTGMVTRLQGETAVTEILIRNGDRVFDSYTEGVQHTPPFQKHLIPTSWVQDIIHYTVWGYGRELIPEIKQTHGPQISCDFSSEISNPATEIMPHLDYSFFSGSKLQEQSINPEKILLKLKEKTPGIVVMTLGEEGSIAIDGDRIFRGIAIPVEVIDTLGAGDAFIAAFLCSRLKGSSIPQSIENGHKTAAEICTRLGAWGGN